MKENIELRGQLRGYLAWPLYLSLFLVIGNGAVAMINVSAAAVLCPFTVGYLAAAGWIYWYRRKRVLGGLVEFSSGYAWIQKQLLEEMVIPSRSTFLIMSQPIPSRAHFSFSRSGLPWPM